jgi:hypothetical protein
MNDACNLCPKETVNIGQYSAIIAGEQSVYAILQYITNAGGSSARKIFCSSRYALGIHIIIVNSIIISLLNK